MALPLSKPCPAWWINHSRCRNISNVIKKVCFYCWCDACIILIFRPQREKRFSKINNKLERIRICNTKLTFVSVSVKRSWRSSVLHKLSTIFVFPVTDPGAHSGPDSGPGRADGPSDPHQASSGLSPSCGLLCWSYHPARHCCRHQRGHWSGPENRCGTYTKTPSISCVMIKVAVFKR